MPELNETACGNFEWNGQTYTESGDYTWTGVAANGCDSVATLHLIINTVDSTDLTEIASNSFSWNGTTYTESGDYTQTYTNINGCDSVVTMHLTIVEINTGITLHEVDGAVDGLHANQDGAAYQWFDCETGEPVINATNQDFYPEVLGSYFVVITLNGASDTSECQSVTSLVGVEDFTVEQVQLYPNPANNWVSIATSSTMKQIEVYNISGKLIERIQVDDSNYMMQTSQLAGGVYIFRIHFTDSYSINRRIVINH